MKVTELGGFSGYHTHLYQALKEAVRSYAQLNEQAAKHPPLNEDTATYELTRLHYSLEQKRIVVVLLAASCVEALANLYLARKSTPEQFATLESATFLEKWTVTPTLFLKEYSFPKGSVLYQDLKRLQIRRNSILHLKATVTDGGKVIHKGKPPEHAGDEAHFTQRCGPLPNELLKHVGCFDKDPTTGVFDIGITLFEWPDNQKLTP